MNADLKLFVWRGDGVLEDYGTGLIVVLAHDLAEALALIRKEAGYAMTSFPADRFEVFEEPAAFYCWGSS